MTLKGLLQSCSDPLGLRLYITIAYSPFHHMLTYKHVFVWFLSPHYCMEEVVFPNVTLEVARQNLI